MKRLHVHIDQLVLEGRTPAEGRLIVKAVEKQLAALVNGSAMPAKAVELSHRASAGDVAGQIAGQIFGKLGNNRRA